MRLGQEVQTVLRRGLTPCFNAAFRRHLRLARPSVTVSGGAAIGPDRGIARSRRWLAGSYGRCNALDQAAGTKRVAGSRHISDSAAGLVRYALWPFTKSGWGGQN